MIFDISCLYNFLPYPETRIIAQKCIWLANQVLSKANEDRQDFCLRVLNFLNHVPRLHWRGNKETGWAHWGQFYPWVPRYKACFKERWGLHPIQQVPIRCLIPESDFSLCCSTSNVGKCCRKYLFPCLLPHVRSAENVSSPHQNPQKKKNQTCWWTEGHQTYQRFHATMQESHPKNSSVRYLCCQLQTPSPKRSNVEWLLLTGNHGHLRNTPSTGYVHSWWHLTCI